LNKYDSYLIKILIVCIIITYKKGNKIIERIVENISFE